MIVAILVSLLPVFVRAAFTLQVTNVGGGQIQILATNIPEGGIRGYCVWETSSNLVTWTPVVTNGVNKTWATNTFPVTNSMIFYRAWVY
jgi:hypothetical protein